MMRILSFLVLILLCNCQQPDSLQTKELKVGNRSMPVEVVNTFLGSSGDHGQLSPAASYPFSMLSIGPQTYPSTHTGYEYLANDFIGFTHTRVEGVGCLGSGGNILIKPILNENSAETELVKKKEKALPGYYGVSFTNGISAEFSVLQNFGIERYKFPNKERGFYVDLSHAFVNRFLAEEHNVQENSISGWIDTQTTCSEGAYRIYYYLEFNHPVQWKRIGEHELIANLQGDATEATVRIGVSSVNTAYARERVVDAAFEEVQQKSQEVWNNHLSRIEVKGDQERKELFYSLLYRTLQSPYHITEKDGYYRAIDGSVQETEGEIYNGWAIWDNYRTQLPLLSIAYPENYKDIAASIANMYLYGKKDWATMHEPSPTVRTEHAIVVLLDAYRKGYPIPFEQIADSLISEVNRLSYDSPDKALESSYDAWALAEILKILGREELSQKYFEQAMEYRRHWMQDFADLSEPDVDKMQARGLYQGTIWQYRWFVPFDVKGLIELTGGEQEYINQLDEFFEKDYYNHANQPDLQVPGMYNVTSEPWKSQALFHKIAVDTTIQHYFNGNNRGIGSHIGKIYKNAPAAYLPTMDDDAGTMSSWFVLTACGLSPACVGWPVYYLNAPLFEEVTFNFSGKLFTIKVKNYHPDYAFIQEASLNGEPLQRNWISHEEIAKGGELIIEASDKPNKEWGTKNKWISKLKMGEQ